jgi:hypothetical protein
MRKNILGLILFTLLATAGNIQAQYKTPAEHAAKYGEGGRYDEDIDKAGVSVDEYYDSEGTLREEVIHGIKVEGMGLPGVQRKYYDCQGRLIYTTTIISMKSGPLVTTDMLQPKPEAKETILYEERVEYKDGKVVRGQRLAITKDWDYHQELKGDPPVWTSAIYVPGPKSFFETEPPPPTSPEECEDDCDTGSELFGGYSFLLGLEDGESESFPLGAHLAYTYMMTKRFGLVADASIHTKKESELRIMRAFLMGGLQYHIMREREKRFVLPMLRVMAGAAFDKQKYGDGFTSDATGFVIAAGFGFQFPINPVLAATILTDYLRVKFKEQDAQNNIRISAGIKFNLSCEYKKK